MLALLKQLTGSYVRDNTQLYRSTDAQHFGMKLSINYKDFFQYSNIYFIPFPCFSFI